jgi:hypothetical protein
MKFKKCCKFKRMIRTTKKSICQPHKFNSILSSSNLSFSKPFLDLNVICLDSWSSKSDFHSQNFSNFTSHSPQPSTSSIFPTKSPKLPCDRFMDHIWDENSTIYCTSQTDPWAVINMIDSILVGDFSLAAHTRNPILATFVHFSLEIKWYKHRDRLKARSINYRFLFWDRKRAEQKLLFYEKSDIFRIFFHEKAWNHIKLKPRHSIRPTHVDNFSSPSPSLSLSPSVVFCRIFINLMAGKLRLFPSPRLIES